MTWDGVLTTIVAVVPDATASPAIALMEFVVPLRPAVCVCMVAPEPPMVTELMELAPLVLPMAPIVTTTYRVAFAVPMLTLKNVQEDWPEKLLLPLDPPTSLVANRDAKSVMGNVNT